MQNQDQTCNGWTNWQTWNVALWIQNDASLHNACKHHKSYYDFIRDLKMVGIESTPDGASFTDSKLDYKALNDLVRDIK